MSHSPADFDPDTCYVCESTLIPRRPDETPCGMKVCGELCEDRHVRECEDCQPCEDCRCPMVDHETGICPCHRPEPTAATAARHPRQAMPPVTRRTLPMD